MSDHDQAELESMIRVAHGEPLLTPPPGLWDQIEAEIEQRPSAAADGPPQSHRTPWVLASLAVAASIILTLIVVTNDNDPSPTTSAIAGGKPRNSSSSSGAPPTPRSTIARAETLEVLDGSEASGTAALQLVGKGQRKQLVVDASGLGRQEGVYHEVWLIDPTVTKLISLGPIRPDDTYNLPAGIDAEAYPVVDISAEPFDGDPAHSGSSVLRGTLDFSA